MAELFEHLWEASGAMGNHTLTKRDGKSYRLRGVADPPKNTADDSPIAIFLKGHGAVLPVFCL